MGRSVKWNASILMIFELLLECGGLIRSALLVRFLGVEKIGILALLSAFFGLISMIGSGNGVLCLSRFVSEALGQKEGNPIRVLQLGLGFALFLSMLMSGGCFLAGAFFSRVFLQTEGCGFAIRCLGLLLPFVAISGCFKGYFNAIGRVQIPAVCDLCVFLLSTLWLIGGILWRVPDTTAALCTRFVHSLALGVFFSTGFLWIAYWKVPRPHLQHQTSAPSFPHYVRLAIPVAFGGVLTAALGMANDGLIPKTLQQFGDSPQRALEQFGVFEGVVLPVLFFPSTVLCALSGVLLPEVARARSARNKGRICHLVSRSIGLTLGFSLLVVLVLFFFGGEIGQWMGGGVQSGFLLRLFAPVVPFIYLEIVLEAILKGMGKQGFSSLNYLVEYVLRIFLVLVCIPKLGFLGVVLSYYGSNVFGNLSRLWYVWRTVCTQTMMSAKVKGTTRLRSSVDSSS